MADPSFTTAQWEQFDAIRQQLIKALSDNGHGMLLGSDAPQLFNVPGFSIHHEMQDMAYAGMTHLQILQSGTVNPARFFGQEDVFGQVKEGLVADLVLLETNPMADLAALQQLAGVFRNGIWYAKADLDKELLEIRERAGKL